MEAKIYDKNGKKIQICANVIFFLSSRISVISLFFFLSISQTPKKYLRFLISIYLCITTPAFLNDRDRKMLRTHTCVGKTLKSWFAIYRSMCCRCICNMYWDCITCFAFHSSPSIKIIVSRMFSSGDKYSATTG